MAKFRLARRQRRGAESHDKARARALSRGDWLELAGVITALCLIVAGAHELRETGTLPIRRVYFESATSKVARAELKKTVTRQLAGNFFTVDLSAIEWAVTRVSWVKSATVRREWPDTLMISIRKQVPVARWGEHKLLNRTGQIFRPQAGRLSADLPILYGPRGRGQTLLARYGQLANVLKSAGLRVRALVQDQRRAWHLLLDNGIPLDIGRGDPRGRVARFAQVYPKALASMAARIAAIDLRYTNGFAVAWRRPDDIANARTDATND